MICCVFLQKKYSNDQQIIKRNNIIRNVWASFLSYFTWAVKQCRSVAAGLFHWFWTPWQRHCTAQTDGWTITTLTCNIFHPHFIWILQSRNYHETKSSCTAAILQPCNPCIIIIILILKCKKKLCKEKLPFYSVYCYAQQFIIYICLLIAYNMYSKLTS